MDTTKIFVAGGPKASHESLVRFVESLGLGPADLELMQVQTLQRLVFLKFVTEEKCTHTAALLNQGVRWPGTDKMVSGWKCEQQVLNVKLINVSPEVPRQVVVDKMEQFGIVLHMERNKFNLRGFQCSDGTWSVKLRLSVEVSHLPHFLHIEETDEFDPQVWQLVHPGQTKPGCWRCNQPGHIGAFCRVSALQPGSSWAQRARQGLQQPRPRPQPSPPPPQPRPPPSSTPPPSTPLAASVTPFLLFY